MFASKDLFFSKPSGYQISRSVRLRSSATAYFNRTPASAGTRTTWTWSGWVKRGALGGNQILFDANGTTNLTNYSLLWIIGDSLEYQEQTTTGMVGRAATTQVFRDPSAWYHIVCVFNSTSATSTITGSSTDRIRLYVNGVQVTAFSSTTVPSQNYTSAWNNTVGHAIGNASSGTSYLFDGYLTEVNFIDGQALTPSSFGQTNTITGVWQPLKYTGTYGTNGFYLNFSDNSNNTATTIGKDYSGNGNNWTPNNISVTAGTTYDSMLDVPTLFADGGNGRGNYAVLNPLYRNSGSTFTYANGNMTVSASSILSPRAIGTVGMDSGAYYWEITITSLTSGTAFTGINSSEDNDGFGGSGYGYMSTGNKRINGTDTAYGATYTTGDIIGVAFDATNRTIEFYKNNASQGVISSVNTGTFVAWFYIGGATATGTTNANFGQRPFTYTPPTGFVALNTQNLPTPAISNGANYMAATTYTGTGSALTIANTVGSASFQPDFVWVKGRSGATDHALYDSVRGTTKDLVSNSTAAETTQATGLTAFGSTGFTVGALAKMNTNAATYVGWQWNAGGSTVTNTNGSISSQVRANTTAGFSVVTYTGTGANATVGHGLGVAPRMVIFKRRDAVAGWPVYHASIGNTGILSLQSTAATSTSATYFNNTSPTSSVFTISTDTALNANTGTYVAYCFSEVAGYSKFGSYTGNGSTDGPFVFCGFRPRFVMIKKTSDISSWTMLDSSRNTANVVDKYLYADSSGAEATFTFEDFLSNGFKLRTTDSSVNTSAGTYIFMAFAENPTKFSLAR